MSIDTEAIAKRFAVRPGCRFVSYKPVGIAIFAMNLRVLAIVAREVPPIDEFILRCLLEDINGIQELSNILGLDTSIVENRLIELRRRECIDVHVNSSNETKCTLTETGRELAQSLRHLVPQEITIPDVMFHGLLRKPFQIGEISRGQYLRPKEAREQGLELVRAIPNRYPHPEEIDARILDSVVKRERHSRSRDGEREIVSVKSVLKQVYTLYEPAVMIEYETETDKRERQVAFVIQGQMKDEYEVAFAGARGPELLGELLTPKQEPIEQRIQRIASSDVIMGLGRFEDVEELASQFVAAEQKVEDAKRELGQTDRADTREILTAKIAQLEMEKAEIEKERNSRKVKYLWTPEIRHQFRKAIAEAQDRLLILSGFISSEVVNHSLEHELRSALNRGVRIWIGYGFDRGNKRGEEQRLKSSWKDAESIFARLQGDFPKLFFFKDLGRSHEKRLICDTKYTFGGSFNLLSFSGENRGREKLRHEGADMIEDAFFCEELYERYIRLFFT